MSYRDDIYVISPARCDHGGIIYFMLCRSPDQQVKIGHANHLARRLSTIQIGCPYAIDVLTYYWSENPEDEEQTLHERFAASRIRGEWFRLTDELRLIIGELQERQRNLLSDILCAP